jgi:hypothetical protein
VHARSLSSVPMVFKELPTSTWAGSFDEAHYAKAVLLGALRW